MTVPAPGSVPAWTFLTNHAQVLLCISRDPEARLRDVAERVGITERAVQGIVADLVHAGYLTRRRVGRRNIYEVHAAGRPRHSFESGRSIAALLEALGATPVALHARHNGSPRTDGGSR